MWVSSCKNKCLWKRYTCNIQTLQNWFQDRRARGRDVTVELRKSKRDDTLTKKRQIEGLTADSTDDEDALRENLSTASMFYLLFCLHGQMTLDMIIYWQNIKAKTLDHYPFKNDMLALWIFFHLNPQLLPKKGYTLHYCSLLLNTPIFWQELFSAVGDDFWQAI